MELLVNQKSHSATICACNAKHVCRVSHRRAHAVPGEGMAGAHADHLGNGYSATVMVQWVVRQRVQVACLVRRDPTKRPGIAGNNRFQRLGVRS